MRTGSVLFLAICIACVGSAHAGLVLTADSVLTLIPFEAQIIMGPPLFISELFGLQGDWLSGIEPISDPFGDLTVVVPWNVFPFHEESFDLETLLGYNHPITAIYPDGSVFFYIPEPSTVLLLATGLFIQLKR